MRLIHRRLTDQASSLLAQSHENPDAFADFYELYARDVTSYFLRRTFDAECAIDLCAETFALALERRRQFRGRTADAERGWLFAIARNLMSHYWRDGHAEQRALGRVGIERPALMADDIERLEHLAGVAQLRRVVAAALGSLPEDQAYAVRQRVLRERSYHDLAVELAVSEDVIRARVSRGLRALGRELDQHDLQEVA